MNRFSRRHRRPSSMQIALFFSLLAGGCGEAKTTIEPEFDGIVGTLHARIATFEDGHTETYYRLVKGDGEELSLNFVKNRDPRIGVGTRIAVRGQLIDKRIEVDGFDRLPLRADEQQQPLRTTLPQNIKVALLNVNKSTTTATLQNRATIAVDSPTNFFKDNSYGATTLSVDVFGPYTYTVTSCAEGNLSTIASDIQALAKAGGVDTSQYDNFMYYLPTQNCGWAGIAEVGVNPVRGFKNGIDTWYSAASDCVVFAQELTHNYGILHSHKCDAPPYASSQYGGSSCMGYVEYGDLYTPMGNGCGHFNAPEMGALQFLSPCNTLAIASSGTYEIGAIESKCQGPQVLKVLGSPNVNQGQQYIYLEYRKGKGTIGSDSKSPKGLYFHASAEYGGLKAPNPPDPDLLYVVDPFYIHAPLTMTNSSWTETTSGATFTLTAIGETATVQVSFPGGGDGGAPKCVDGTTPPSSPMCGAVDGGTGGTGGMDASTDSGKGGAAGSAGSGGAAGSAGSSGSAGTGTTDAGRDTGTAGTAGTAGSGGGAGTAGTAGTGGAAGKGGTGGTAGTSATGGTGGTSGSGGSGTGGSGTGGSAGSGTGGSGGSAGSSGSTGTGGKGGSGATGGSTGGSGGGGTADDGCSCAVPGSKPSNSAPVIMLGLAALVPVLRRRSRRSAT